MYRWILVLFLAFGSINANATFRECEKARALSKQAAEEYKALREKSLKQEPDGAWAAHFWASEFLAFNNFEQMIQDEQKKTVEIQTQLEKVSAMYKELNTIKAKAKNQHSQAEVADLQAARTLQIVREKERELKKAEEELEEIKRIRKNMQELIGKELEKAYSKLFAAISEARNKHDQLSKKAQNICSKIIPPYDGGPQP